MSEGGSHGFVGTDAGGCAFFFELLDGDGLGGEENVPVEGGAGPFLVELADVLAGAWGAAELGIDAVFGFVSYLPVGCGGVVAEEGFEAIGGFELSSAFAG